MNYHLEIQNKKYAVEIGVMENGCIPVTVNDTVFHVTLENLAAPAPKAITTPKTATHANAGTTAVSPIKAASGPMTSGWIKTASPAIPVSGNGAVKAPIPGLILEVKVATGDAVVAGQTVAIMEAMKMENNISSPVAGKVMEVRVAKGATVADGDILMLINTGHPD